MQDNSLLQQPLETHGANRVHFILQPVKVATGTDDESGVVVLLDGRMVAVLVKLAAECHGDMAGHWHVEAAFGPVGQTASTFPQIAGALRWIAQRLGLAGAEVQLEIAAIGRGLSAAESSTGSEADGI